jgi:hypothetical protein
MKQGRPPGQAFSGKSVTSKGQAGSLPYILWNAFKISRVE